MIIDLQRFVAVERPYWTELEQQLDKLEANPNRRLSLEQLQHFHLLYERTAADLAKLTTFSSEPETRRYLENLVGRAYGEMHETRERRSRLQPLRWFFQTLPQAFRRHIRAFYFSLAITIAGCLFGGLAIALDPGSKPVLMPFEHLLQDPTKRVAEEEQLARNSDNGGIVDRLAGRKATFSAMLMQNNITVSIKTLAFGMTWGVGTLVVLFHNGLMLGAVAVDYIRAGQTRFLCGWLLPHGVIEIPAILIAGQAGLLLASALIGWGRRTPLRRRLREITPDVVTLIFGVALLLVWAGLVEAFLSQYHEPVISYSTKIAFGVVELGLLILFLSKSGGAAPQTPLADAPESGRGLQAASTAERAQAPDPRQASAVSTLKRPEDRAPSTLVPPPS